MAISPPRPKGPPLNALRAFEAAARLGGFTRAAEELSVTPGAISQHIRALEDWAGAPLFERRSQGVALTQQGARLAPKFTDAFDRLGEAVRDLRAVTPDPVIQIAALPSVAQLWLLPRMRDIRAALPGVKLTVSALEAPPNLSREMFDLSLFIRIPGEVRDEVILQEDAIMPVCAPELAAQINTPDDLARQVLLHDESWIGDWQHWAEAMGCALPEAGQGLRFTLYSMALEEAMNGAGVLMGHAALVQRALDDGRLVAPFQGRIRTGRSLVLEMAGKSRRTLEIARIVPLLG